MCPATNGRWRAPEPSVGRMRRLSGVRGRLYRFALPVVPSILVRVRFNARLFFWKKNESFLMLVEEWWWVVDET